MGGGGARLPQSPLLGVDLWTMPDRSEHTSAYRASTVSEGSKVLLCCFRDRRSQLWSFCWLSCFLISIGLIVVGVVIKLNYLWILGLAATITIVVAWAFRQWGASETWWAGPTAPGTSGAPLDQVLDRHVRKEMETKTKQEMKLEDRRMSMYAKFKEKVRWERQATARQSKSSRPSRA
ncbi:unnamed protein product [Vitrella brassicaformis CCMP3155]|uniref:Uncharacterized protein n=1 Tax=Vitrella brassicaformis (strain CCMP3155) TaxID=1169540 RepID=A0A0G4H0K2_VITBC|nr:unnamed protein product [Vitrella brassicaformis CCMP3155]|eukprot:CEM37063.1 unnamed protein product [Vitrella brassicaformis CCMP3155]